MSTLTVAAGSTKFALLNQLSRRQSTVMAAADEAGVLHTDFARRSRELLSAGLIEWTGKLVDGRNVVRITPTGRAVCRTLKARTR